MSATWTTREGETIPIEKLTDSHLMNCIRLLERLYARTIGLYLIGPGPQGEMAQDAFDREFDALDEGGPETINESYTDLVEEADARGIDNRRTRDDRRLSLDLAVLQAVTRRKL